MITRYTLEMDCGVTVQAQFNVKSGSFKCKWTPEPPFTEKMVELIKKEYVPWRDEIFNEWIKEITVKI
jgi:hypothetical protein